MPYECHIYPAGGRWRWKACVTVENFGRETQRTIGKGASRFRGRAKAKADAACRKHMLAEMVDARRDAETWKPSL